MTEHEQGCPWCTVCDERAVRIAELEQQLAVAQQASRDDRAAHWAAEEVLHDTLAELEVLKST